MLHIEGIVKRFGWIMAVEAVTVHFPVGLMVAIVDRSGAGKSTFLCLIKRLIEPTLCDLHALYMAPACGDRIIGMAHGRAVFDGSAAALTATAVREVYDAGEDGIDSGAFFGRTGFSGRHEYSVMANLNGSYDAAAPW